jgi:hypothetical protein
MAMLNLNEPNRPNYVRPEAAAVHPDLDLITDLLGGTRRMWDASNRRQYIRKWSDEFTAVYNIRRQCESVFEGLARVLSAAVGMVWAKLPGMVWNASEERMTAHWANLDGAGVSGPVLCKRFTDQAIRDGIGLILVDHPEAPTGVEVITEKVAEDFNLRPTWALYTRRQVLSWRMETVNNRAVPVQVVLEERGYAPDGAYGVKARTRYRVLRLLPGAATETDPGGPTATWEVYEETGDGSLGGVQSIATGSFRNRDGAVASQLPIAVAYTGRTDAPFCATIPLLGVAYANLSHWQLSTELRFGRMVAAIEQPVIIGELLGGTTTAPAKLKLGWLSGVRVAEGGDYKWVGPSGSGLASLVEGVKEKLEQIGQMGMSFLVSDTRAAETAEAKRLDATAENSTLATAAQGIEDAINAALEIHAWYLGIEKAGAPVMTINKDFENTAMDPQTMTAYIDAVVRAGLPARLLLDAWQQGGRIPADTDLDELEQEMLAGQAAREEQERADAAARAAALTEQAA